MIEVGDFVRTRNGKIRKVKSTVAQYYITDRLNISDNNQFEKEDIVKHSKNIIDIIEVGDYVNGMKIDDIGEIKRFEKPAQKCLWVNIGDGIDIIDEEIKDVLTKEQYEQNCFKIEQT